MMCFAYLERAKFDFVFHLFVYFKHEKKKQTLFWIKEVFGLNKNEYIIIIIVHIN